MERFADVTTRRARPDDASSIARLHADSWRRHYRGAYSDTFLDGDVESDRLAVWSARLADRDAETATIVAEDPSTDSLCGFAHVVFDSDPDWGSLVDNLHVVWTHKGNGLGTQLMSDAAAALLERDRKALYLWVLEQNTAAQAFYGARGGICVGSRLVVAPGNVPDRLSGAPVGLRYAWADAATLIV